MDIVIQFLFEHAQYAHWIVFGALMLAGLNVPISEDLMIIFSAVLAATVVPENTYKLFLALFLGAYLSDWVCYWVGRRFGPKLWHIGLVRQDVRSKKNRSNTGLLCQIWLLDPRCRPFYPLRSPQWPLFKRRTWQNALRQIHPQRRDRVPPLEYGPFHLRLRRREKLSDLLSSLKIFNILLFAAFAVAVIALIWYKRKKKAAT